MGRIDHSGYFEKLAREESEREKATLDAELMAKLIAEKYGGRTIVFSKEDRKPYKIPGRNLLKRIKTQKTQSEIAEGERAEDTRTEKSTYRSHRNPLREEDDDTLRKAFLDRLKQEQVYDTCFGGHRKPYKIPGGELLRRKSQETNSPSHEKEL